MEKVFEAVFGAILMFTLATGGACAVKKVGIQLKRAALIKAAQGLPPLPRYSKNQ